MSFADLLKEQRRRKSEADTARKRETFEKMGYTMVNEAVEAIKSGCLAAADDGKSFLSGYVAQYQSSGEIIPAITEFDKGQNAKPFGGGVFIINNYGTDGKFAEYIRSGLCKELLKLQFDKMDVRVEKRMFYALTAFSEQPLKPHGPVLKQDREKFVVHVRVEW